MTAQADSDHIGLVVEGLGDERSIPLMCRSIAHSMQIYGDVFGKPVTCHSRSNADRQGGLEAFADIASRRSGCRALIVVLDSDDDLPCSAGPAYRTRLQSRISIPYSICLIQRNWEDVIYASAETIGLGMVYRTGTHGSSAIKRAMRDRAYVKSTHQARFTARVDVETARQRNQSFDRFVRQVEWAIGVLTSAGGPR